MAEPRPSRAARVILALRRHADRPWFLPAVGIFPLCDFVLPFLPNPTLLIGLSMTLPRRCRSMAATFVAAAAFGAALTALAVQHLGTPFIERLFGAPALGAAASPVLSAVKRYGLFALVGLAMLPWPPRTAVFVCAGAGLPPLMIGLAVTAGRMVPAYLCARIGAQSPQLFRRFALVDQLLQEVETRAMAPGADQTPARFISTPARQ